VKDFEAVANRFYARIPRQPPGSAWLLERLRITKQRRTAYDHIMLCLHDSVKRDDAYQKNTTKHASSFAPARHGSCSADRVMHAAIAGQHALEQTFYLPVECDGGRALRAAARAGKSASA
jgi:hypothetical protein